MEPRQHRHRRCRQGLPLHDRQQHLPRGHRVGQLDHRAGHDLGLRADPRRLEDADLHPERRRLDALPRRPAGGAQRRRHPPSRRHRRRRDDRQLHRSFGLQRRQPPARQGARLPHLLPCALGRRGGRAGRSADRRARGGARLAQGPGHDRRHRRHRPAAGRAGHGPDDPRPGVRRRRGRHGLAVRPGRLHLAGLADGHQRLREPGLDGEGRRDALAGAAGALRRPEHRGVRRDLLHLRDHRRDSRLGRQGLLRLELHRPRRLDPLGGAVPDPRRRERRRPVGHRQRVGADDHRAGREVLLLLLRPQRLAQPQDDRRGRRGQPDGPVHGAAAGDDPQQRGRHLRPGDRPGRLRGPGVGQALPLLGQRLPGDGGAGRRHGLAEARDDLGDVRAHRIPRGLVHELPRRDLPPHLLHRRHRFTELPRRLRHLHQPHRAVDLPWRDPGEGRVAGHPRHRPQLDRAGARDRRVVHRLPPLRHPHVRAGGRQRHQPGDHDRPAHLR